MHNFLPSNTTLIYALCCFGFSQKQTLSQCVKCKEFMWQVIPGDISVGEGKSGSEGKAAIKVCFQTGSQCEWLRLNPAGELWDLRATPQRGQECWVFIYTLLPASQWWRDFSQGGGSGGGWVSSTPYTSELSCWGQGGPRGQRKTSGKEVAGDWLLDVRPMCTKRVRMRVDVCKAALPHLSSWNF